MTKFYFIIIIFCEHGKPHVGFPYTKAELIPTWLFALGYVGGISSQGADDEFGACNFLLTGPDAPPHEQRIRRLQHEDVVGVEAGCTRGHLKREKEKQKGDLLLTY